MGMFYTLFLETLAFVIAITLIGEVWYQIATRRTKKNH